MQQSISRFLVGFCYNSKVSLSRTNPIIIGMRHFIWMRLEKIQIAGNYQMSRQRSMKRDVCGLFLWADIGKIANHSEKTCVRSRIWDVLIKFQLVINLDESRHLFDSHSHLQTQHVLYKRPHQTQISTLFKRVLKEEVKDKTL